MQLRIDCSLFRSFSDPETNRTFILLTLVPFLINIYPFSEHAKRLVKKLNAGQGE